MPTGDVGGSVWSTPVVDPSGTVYITTGNGPDDQQLLGTSESIVALNGTTLAMTGSWQAPMASMDPRGQPVHRQAHPGNRPTRRSAGAPTLDGGNVLAVATYDVLGAPNAVYLLNATTGAILATLNNGDSPEFAEPVFAGPYIFLSTVSSGLIAYEVPTT